jgi:hypothetical protein
LSESTSNSRGYFSPWQPKRCNKHRIGFRPGHKNVNCLKDEEAEDRSSIARKQNEGNFASRPIEPELESKRVPLELRVPDKTVMISQDLTTSEEAKLLSFFYKTTTCSQGEPPILWE